MIHTTLTPDERLHQLHTAIADLQKQADQLRSERTALAAGLAKGPTDTSILDQVIGIGAELNRISIVQDAMETERDRLLAVDAEERRAEAIAAVQERKASVIKRSAARATLAAKVQAAGDAFVAAVGEWKAAGEGLRDDVVEVLRAHHDLDPNRVSEALMFLGPVAAGNGTTIAEAVAATAKRACDALGSAYTGDSLVFNLFNMPRIDFETAAAKDHGVLVDRFAGLAKPIGKVQA